MTERVLSAAFTCLVNILYGPLTMVIVVDQCNRCACDVQRQVYCYRLCPNKCPWKHLAGNTVWGSWTSTHTSKFHTIWYYSTYLTAFKTVFNWYQRNYLEPGLTKVHVSCSQLLYEWLQILPPYVHTFLVLMQAIISSSVSWCVGSRDSLVTWPHTTDTEPPFNFVNVSF